MQPSDLFLQLSVLDGKAIFVASRVHRLTSFRFLHQKLFFRQVIIQWRFQIEPLVFNPFIAWRAIHRIIRVVHINQQLVQQHVIVSMEAELLADTATYHRCHSCRKKANR